MKRLNPTRTRAPMPFRIPRSALLCVALTAPLVALADAIAPKPPAVMPEMDHSKMDHGDMKSTPQGSMKDQRSDTMEGMDHDGMKGLGSPGVDMDRMMDSMQGGSPPPDARDPDAYADGLESGHLPGMDMADNDVYGQLRLDQFEGYRSNSGQTGLRLDAQAWFGNDLNKLWLKVDGSRSNGTLGATRTEVLYNRAFAPYFGWQAGLRHDFGGGPSRNWAALGIQGLAPYWFEVEATAYVGESGRTALRLEAEYDLRITQRLVLQPDAEVNLFGKSDPERGIGSGFSEAEFGLRLRYEVTRKFAPYVGVTWGRKFGNTADMARQAGEDVGETRFVLGLRLWF
ncbi:MAG: copper resistance protein B [Burkholderiales bacterium]